MFVSHQTISHSSLWFSTVTHIHVQEDSWLLRTSGLRRALIPGQWHGLWSLVQLLLPPVTLRLRRLIVEEGESGICVCMCALLCACVVRLCVCACVCVCVCVGVCVVLRGRCTGAQIV